MLERAASWVWYGGGPLAAAARLALSPLELAYGLAAGVRSRLYERGTLASDELAIPAVSVGNLSVGGTGKTPVAAWLAAELAAHGARPAIVMRGYGSDEPLVHAALNPTVPVIVTADRVLGAARAREQHGCDVAVLDDAFQHRRARRTADIVLLSADLWTGRSRLLPAGPFREPLRALRRASLALVTRKAASAERAAEVAAAAARVAPEVPVARVHLAPGELRSPTRAPLPLGALRGARVLAVCAIGDPAAFIAQLRALGAEVDADVRPDHHAFRSRDAEALAARAETADYTVSTLKDAVKLDRYWPRAAPPLWYVSQLVIPEQGREEIDRLVARVLAERRLRP